MRLLALVLSHEISRSKASLYLIRYFIPLSSLGDAYFSNVEQVNTYYNLCT